MISANSARALTDNLGDIERHLVGLAAGITRHTEIITTEHRATLHRSGFTAAEGLDASLGLRQLHVLIVQRLHGLGAGSLLAAARVPGALDQTWADKLREHINASAKAAAA